MYALPVNRSDDESVEHPFSTSCSFPSKATELQLLLPTDLQAAEAHLHFHRHQPQIVSVKDLLIDQVACRNSEPSLEKLNLSSAP